MDLVGDWMSSPAMVIDESTPLPAARDIMQQRRIGRLPVVNAQGQLIGIVSQGDINRVSDSHEFDVRIYNLYHRVSDLPIREIMTRDVVTVDIYTLIAEVAQLLLDHGVGGVPVVSKGRVLGMITESDLFRLIVAHEGEMRQELQAI